MASHSRALLNKQAGKLVLRAPQPFALRSALLLLLLYFQQLPVKNVSEPETQTRANQRIIGSLVRKYTPAVCKESRIRVKLQLQATAGVPVPLRHIFEFTPATNQAVRRQAALAQRKAPDCAAIHPIGPAPFLEIRINPKSEETAREVI